MASPAETQTAQKWTSTTVPPRRIQIYLQDWCGVEFVRSVFRAEREGRNLEMAAHVRLLLLDLRKP